MFHATAPFITAQSIAHGLAVVQAGEYDSSLAVRKHNDFLWKDGKPVNYNVCLIPRTQDLTPFYTETSGMYVFTRELAIQRRRVGDRPFLVEVSGVEATDIDEPLDFEIANAIYNQILLKKQAAK